MPFSYLYLSFFVFSVFLSTSCALIATRPVQEMSLTSAAIRAAREVQADTLSPDLYRQANDWFTQAKHEYRLKNFHLASQYADRARQLAEKAEFESVRNGGNRVEEGGPDPLGNGLPQSPPLSEIQTSPAVPYDYPIPTPTPADAPGPQNPAGGPPNPAGGQNPPIPGVPPADPNARPK